MVADSSNYRIESFTPSGTYGGLQFGQANLGFPTGIATDSSGNIYVVDQAYGSVLEFSSSGVLEKTLDTSLSTSSSYSNYIAINSTGFIFVTDTGNNQVKIYNPSGGLQGTFGGTGSSNGLFNSPTGIAIDSSGDILVTDSGNNRIQVFDSHTNYQTQFGSSGSGINNFNAPSGISLDSSGTLYIADSNNNRIEIFTNAPPASASITISNLANPSFLWGVNVNISGTVVDPAISGDTVTINWGDGGPTSTVNVISSGTSGTWTATHQYPPSAADFISLTNNIVATLFNGATPRSTSNTESVSITAHHTALTLSSPQAGSSLPWGAPILVSGKLTDLDVPTNIISSQPITFADSYGVVTPITGVTTNSTGGFSTSGNAPGALSVPPVPPQSGLQIQSSFAAIPGYLASTSTSISFSTIPHATSLTLGQINNVPPLGPISVTGKLTDLYANAGVSSQPITFTGSGLGTPITGVTTNSTGGFTAPSTAPSSVSSGLSVTAHFLAIHNTTIHPLWDPKLIVPSHNLYYFLHQPVHFHGVH